ncbi:glycosyl transferase [Aureococcus anophagefferens]|nr:glycosyl transferase [Aureococcus anophagefferens]
MNASPSFDKLEQLIKNNQLRLVFLLGLARGGTTATEKFLYERLPFDAQVNEPSLLGPPAAGVSRAEATFARVLAAVEAVDAAVATVVVKEVTNKVLPAMVPLWARLARWWIIVIRSPCLQFESRLKSMLDRVDSGALEAFGVSPDARALRVHGEVVVEAHNDATWREAWAAMKAARDFSRLGPGALLQMDGGAALEARVRARVFGGRVDAPPKRAFDVCAQRAAWSDDDWRKWYGAPCFEKVLKSRAIEAVSKSPMRLSAFPACARPALRRAARAYGRLLLADGRGMPPPPRATRASTCVQIKSTTRLQCVDALHDLVTAECHRAYGADAAGDLAVASLDALDRGGEAPPRFVPELAFAGLVLVAQALMVLQCVPAYVRDALARPRPSGSASSRPKTLSVVVPAHNEARGSELLDVRRGPGPALAAGAAAATGDAVLFLHGDTRPPLAYDALVLAALAEPGTTLAAFGFALDGSSGRPALAAVELGAHVRSTYLELPWGDQGLALSKATLADLGGVARMPLLEDLDLALRARKRGRVVTLREAALTSPRRFLKAGILKTNALNALTLLWWHVGATPEQLFRLYYGRPR